MLTLDICSVNWTKRASVYICFSVEDGVNCYHLTERRAPSVSFCRNNYNDTDKIGIQGWILEQHKQRIDCVQKKLFKPYDSHNNERCEGLWVTSIGISTGTGGETTLYQSAMRCIKVIEIIRRAEGYLHAGYPWEIHHKFKSTQPFLTITFFLGLVMALGFNTEHNVLHKSQNACSNVAKVTDERLCKILRLRWNS